MPIPNRIISCACGVDDDATTGSGRIFRKNNTQLRSGMLKIAKYVLYDILRNRIVLGYAAFLFVAAITFFNLEGDGTKVS